MLSAKISLHNQHLSCNKEVIEHETAWKSYFVWYADCYFESLIHILTYAASDLNDRYFFLLSLLDWYRSDANFHLPYTELAKSTN